MFGQYSQINQNEALKQKNIKHNSSSNMHNVLYGSHEQQQVNKTYFIDSLQRFKKDFAVCHKEERQVMKQKKNEFYRNRYDKIYQANQRCYQNNEVHDMKQTMKVANYQSLYDLGIKKTGTTTGIPVNPINHEYYDLSCAKSYKQKQNEKKMNHLLRQHHIQKNNSSGYNLINGRQNMTVERIVPQQFRAGMDSRLHQYQQHYSLKPPYFY